MEGDTEMRCNFCDTDHMVRCPTIHLNGTSAHELFEALDTAIDAIRVGQKRLAQAAPNGRDYYPQGSEGVSEAVNQHERRYDDLQGILAELTEMRDHVAKVMEYTNGKSNRVEMRPKGE